MATSVLKSDQAIAMSLYVVRAFVIMREALAETKELQRKLTELEQKVTAHFVILNVVRLPFLETLFATSAFSASLRLKNVRLILIFTAETPRTQS